ncbi:MAG: GNAT family N-acetyltransferase [Candidatus Cloacimonetes bacterium]|nr:GNAT family N-acetyltransferase [Candidatus Cloacimonadota bacterium]
MSQYEIVKVTTKKELEKFIKFPFDLYKSDPYWVAPLIADQKKFFDPRYNPYFEHSEVQLLLVLLSGKVCGCISAHTNNNHNSFHQDKKGFFGFFECINNSEVAKILLTEAEKWLREKDCNVMSGPYNFSTNSECGLLIDGFDSPPFVMMTHNYPYYAALIEKAGYNKTMDLYAWLLTTHEMPAFLESVGKRFEKNKQFTIRCLNKKHLAEDIRTVFSIYQKAWAPNWGFVPMSEKEFDHLVDSLLPIIDPELVFIAECDGQPAGFSVALPNYNIILQKIKGKMNPLSIAKFLYYKNKMKSLRVITLGVIPEFLGKGIDTLFYYETWKTGLKKGFTTGEFSWVLETNTMMNKIARHLGATVHKTYRIYEKDI